MMRKFGTDAPEFLSFQLGESDKVYKIPLAASMTYAEIRSLQKAEASGDSFGAQVDILRTYMGDIVDGLEVGVLSDILLAWQEESQKQGAEPGES